MMDTSTAPDTCEDASVMPQLPGDTSSSATSSSATSSCSDSSSSTSSTLRSEMVEDELDSATADDVADLRGESDKKLSKAARLLGVDTPPTLDETLASGVLLRLFLQHMRRAQAPECLLFLKQAALFARLARPPAELQRAAVHILWTYVVPGAPLEVNISAGVRAPLVRVLWDRAAAAAATPRLFDAAAGEVRTLIAPHYRAWLLRGQWAGVRYTKTPPPSFNQVIEQDMLCARLKAFLAQHFAQAPAALASAAASTESASSTTASASATGNASTTTSNNNSNSNGSGNNGNSNSSVTNRARVRSAAPAPVPALLYRCSRISGLDIDSGAVDCGRLIDFCRAVLRFRRDVYERVRDLGETERRAEELWTANRDTLPFLRREDTALAAGGSTACAPFLLAAEDALQRQFAASAAYRAWLKRGDWTLVPQCTQELRQTRTPDGRYIEPPTLAAFLTSAPLRPTLFDGAAGAARERDARFLLDVVALIRAAGKTVVADSSVRLEEDCALHVPRLARADIREEGRRLYRRYFEGQYVPGCGLVGNVTGTESTLATTTTNSSNGSSSSSNSSTSTMTGSIGMTATSGSTGSLGGSNGSNNSGFAGNSDGTGMDSRHGSRSPSPGFVGETAGGAMSPGTGAAGAGAGAQGGGAVLPALQVDNRLRSELHSALFGLVSSRTATVVGALRRCGAYLYNHVSATWLKDVVALHVWVDREYDNHAPAARAIDELFDSSAVHTADTHIVPFPEDIAASPALHAAFMSLLPDAYRDAWSAMERLVRALRDAPAERTRECAQRALDHFARALCPPLATALPELAFVVATLAPLVAACDACVSTLMEYPRQLVVMHVFQRLYPLWAADRAWRAVDWTPARTALYSTESLEAFLLDDSAPLPDDRRVPRWGPTTPAVATTAAAGSGSTSGTSSTTTTTSNSSSSNNTADAGNTSEGGSRWCCRGRRTRRSGRRRRSGRCR